MKLTATNACNDRVIEMMFGKALCAYANWKSTEDDREQLTALYGKDTVEKSIVAHQSEYEATVRCLAMLTVEHLPQVCMAVIEQAEEEFGI